MMSKMKMLGVAICLVGSLAITCRSAHATPYYAYWPDGTVSFVYPMGAETDWVLLIDGTTGNLFSLVMDEYGPTSLYLSNGRLAPYIYGEFQYFDTAVGKSVYDLYYSDTGNSNSWTYYATIYL